MPYVKLDKDILTSSLWIDSDVALVFITALLMAEPYELRDPSPQIEIGSLDETGFTVPPGWYGFVPAAAPGLIGRAMLPKDRGYAALRVLASPDPDSRSQEYGGRRLVRINGGFVVLNYIRYREKDHTAADRMRRYRARKAENAAEEKPKPKRRRPTRLAMQARVGLFEG